MTKEQYIEKDRAITQQIDELQEKRRELSAQYIEANKPFEIGQKIKNKNGELGIVDGYKIGYSGKVEVTAKKVKKDGTASAHNLWLWYDTEIQVVN